MVSVINKKTVNAVMVEDTSLFHDLNFLQVSINAIPIGVIVCDKEGSIRLVNKEISRVFGYEETEMINHPIEMLMPSRYRTAHPGMMRSFFTNPAARPMGAGRDLYAATKDGREFPVEIGLTPFESQGDSYVVATIIDITQRRDSDKL